MPVINEITEDDVNDLSDQIRQLKEELIRENSSTHNSIAINSGYFKGRNARESLNQLRLSLNRSLILPRLDNDSEEDLNVDEEDVRELRDQLDNLHSSCENNSREPSDNKDCIQLCSFEESSEPDMASELDTSPCLEESKIEENHLGKYERVLPTMDNDGPMENLLALPGTSSNTNPAVRSSLSIKTCQQSPVLHDPTLSESPKIVNILTKSLVSSSNLLASQNHVSESSKFNPGVLRQSLRSDLIRSSLQSNKISTGPTESLASSLQRGLQIIDYHQKNSASNKSSVAFSFEHLTLEPCQSVDKTDASVQTLPEVQQSDSFLCASCKRTRLIGSSQVQDSFNMWIEPVKEEGTPEGSTKRVPKDAEKVLAEAINREKDLENLCAEQAAKIEQLNYLVEQYKNEREHNFSMQQSQETKTHHLEALVNGGVAIEELKNDDHPSLEDENKMGLSLARSCSERMLKSKIVLRSNSEVKEVQEELDHGYINTSFDMSEREVLLKEIQSLKSKLQSYMNASSNELIEKQNNSLFLSRSIQLRKSGVSTRDKSEEDIEMERQRWTEMESEWISLTDELRIDLESNRRHAEKVEAELRVEKKCTEELDDALQRSVLGHARIVEHYTELQEKYNEMFEKHRKIMEGIAEVKRAAAKAGAKGSGSRFAKSLAAELSALRVEREREREYLKKENKSLKIQLRDTAEAVHAAGELLVRLREAEEAVSVAEENFMRAQQETEKMKKQMEKLKRKHKMEMVTMKQYLAESRLPESALRPLYRQDSDMADSTTTMYANDDQAWRDEFGPTYQEHY